MLKSNLAIFTLLLFFLSGCSESIRELESRIKKQAEKNNTEMSAMEIKQTAIYLNEWSKEDFFQDDVNEFLEADKADFPEGIEILFAGSSSIRFWKSLEKDMNPLKVLNRGFGGSIFSDLTQFIFNSYFFFIANSHQFLDQPFSLII